MSEIFGAALMGGGGKTDAFAAIEVTYPEGATCTCSLDSEVLKAPDTSGSALFIVPTAGEWTVTISQSGKEPVSEIVNVNESKTYTVSLSFTFYLFYNGDQIESITGGWVAKALGFEQGNGWMLKAPNLTITDEMIITAETKETNGSVVTNNAIDLTDYSTAKFKMSVAVNADKDPRIGFVKTQQSILRPAVQKIFNRSASITTYTLDISNLSGAYYPFFGVWRNLDGGDSFSVSEVILEP